MIKGRINWSGIITLFNMMAVVAKLGSLIGQGGGLKGTSMLIFSVMWICIVSSLDFKSLEINRIRIPFIEVHEVFYLLI